MRGEVSRLAEELLPSRGQCYIKLLHLYLKDVSGNAGRWEQFVQILKFRWRSFMFIVTRRGGN